MAFATAEDGTSSIMSLPIPVPSEERFLSHQASTDPPGAYHVTSRVDSTSSSRGERRTSMTASLSMSSFLSPPPLLPPPEVVQTIPFPSTVVPEGGSDRHGLGREGSNVGTIITNGDMSTVDSLRRMLQDAPLLEGVAVVPLWKEGEGSSGERSKGTTPRWWKGKTRVAMTALAAVCLILAAGALASWASTARKERVGRGKVEGGREDLAYTTPTLPPEEEADGDENGAILAEVHDGNEEEEEEEWETLGSPIIGLSNESGVVQLYDPTSKMVITFTGDSVSNFTNSGGSLALSDDGHTLLIGESGTDTVRVFVWDDESLDWTRKGQILSLKPDPEECGSTTYFPECFISFGFKVHISGDGDIVTVSSPGYHNMTGMVRTYRWEEASSSWTRMGQDMVGYGHRDLLGGGGHQAFTGRQDPGDGSDSDCRL